MPGADPVNCAFYLAIGSGASRFTLKVYAATKLDHFAFLIFHHLVALNDVSVLEPYFAPRFEPEIFRRRDFREVRGVDKQLATEWNFPRSSRLILGVVDRVEFFDRSRLS